MEHGEVVIQSLQFALGRGNRWLNKALHKAAEVSKYLKILPQFFKFPKYQDRPKSESKNNLQLTEDISRSGKHISCTALPSQNGK